MIIVLNRVQMAENLGFAARNMKNFGLEELRLVEPGLVEEANEHLKNINENFNAADFFEKARAVAKGGAEIIEKAKIYKSVAEATDGIEVLYALSARRREISKEIITPRSCIEEIIKFEGRSALLFGAEASGLSNKDIVLCKKMVEIETSDTYSSINLGMSVGIMAYLFCSTIGEQHFKARERKVRNKADLNATSHLVSFLQNKLYNAGYFKAPEKQTGMMINIGNLFTKAGLTHAECCTLHGIFSLIKSAD